VREREERAREWAEQQADFMLWRADPEFAREVGIAKRPRRPITMPRVSWFYGYPRKIG
jgi:hypothetical protein